MSGIILTEKNASGLSEAELEKAIEQSLECSSGNESGKKSGKILIIAPDFTRFHSNAGFIANRYYHLFTKSGASVDILIALGTHAPMTEKECGAMYGDIPFSSFIMHNWRSGIKKLGVVPAAFVSEVSEGLVNTPIDVEVNEKLFSGYSLIISAGQVVPHEVVGMANHSKNIFVGAGGSSMINSSHMLGAFYGMERIMGRDHSPVRKVFDYAAEHFLQSLQLYYALTVTTAPGGKIHTHGFYFGKERKFFELAVKQAQKTNLTFVDKPLKKVVVYLDESEFKSTWLGNKAVYRTRMAIADGGELIVLAPGADKFGEDAAIDALIRKYGYAGREKIVKLCAENADLKGNLSAAAHLIHGSSDGRFSITYCTQHLSRAEVEGVCFRYAPYAEAAARYNPAVLKAGYNTLPDGEEIYYIPNPALGLWSAQSF